MEKKAKELAALAVEVLEKQLLAHPPGVTRQEIRAYFAMQRRGLLAAWTQALLPLVAGPGLDPKAPPLLPEALPKGLGAAAYERRWLAALGLVDAAAVRCTLTATEPGQGRGPYAIVLWRPSGRTRVSIPGPWTGRCPRIPQAPLQGAGLYEVLCKALRALSQKGLHHLGDFRYLGLRKKVSE